MTTLYFNRKENIIENETWKNIPGFLGYSASNLGRVKSEKRIIYQSNGHPISIKEKILNQRFDKYGYLIVSIKNAPGNQNRKVHVLCCKAFHENPSEKKTVNHKKGIRHDNRETEIEWATTSENVLHGFKVNKRIHPMTGKTGAWKGKKRSAETRANMSKAGVKRWADKKLK